MNKILLGLVVGALGMFAWQRMSQPAPAAEPAEFAEYADDGAEPLVEQPSRESRGFSCDGRTRCPEMHSCAEAQYFLDHCPGVKMDGDRDGIPCEGQWCGH